MPDPNAIVSVGIGLKPPLDRPAVELLRAEGGLSVELDEERSIRLDPTDPRSPGFAQVLDGLAKLRRPVYLEIDPDTGTIARLLIPHVTRVAAINPNREGGYDIALERSHARHALRRDQADFEELARELRQSLEQGRPLIITEDDAHNIIDVRGYTPGPDDGPLPPWPKPDIPPLERRWWKDLLDWIWRWPFWPWWWFRCVSKTTAQQIFDAMSATSCDPLTVPSPCIPFRYPDNGCWARAHEMCRLTINMGRSPRKVWIQGTLHTPTRNHPNCFVNWYWHVAPTLCVRQKWFWTQRMVIDPSIFTTPVSEAAWKAVQGDPGATLTHTAASVYLWGNVTDPGYVQTNQDLSTHRLLLQSRAIQQGPPPYAQCP